MHSIESNVPAFLVKLWKLVEDCSCDDLITWSENGNSFIIQDEAKFAKELLPLYFKHNNMASFIRQLNMYGFRKSVNYEKGGLKVENNEVQFYNPFFMRGNADLLDCIKRKIPTKGGGGVVGGGSGESSSGNTRTDPNDLLSDLSSIRERQESMNNLLIGMKKENELLWRELSTLRKKHKTQEQIIQKVIQFLVTLVRTGKPNVGVKRPIARMLRNGKSPSSTKSRQLDVVRSKASDLFITVPTEKLASPVGPVIHEVLDQDELGSPLSTSSRDSDKFLLGNSSPENYLGSQASPAEQLVSLDLLDPIASNVSIMSAEEPEAEQILGLDSDFITSDGVCVPDIASVLSLPEDDTNIITTTLPADKSVLLSEVLPPAETSNVISIPDVAAYVSIAEDVSNLISVPEGTNVISLLGMPTAGTKQTGGDCVTSTVSKTPVTSPSSSSLVLDTSPCIGRTSVMNSAAAMGGILARTAASMEQGLDDIKDVDIEPLATPKILEAFDSDLEMFNNSSDKSTAKKNPLFSSKNSDSNEMQLSISGSAGKLKNSLSSHVKNVEDNLDWLQSQMSPDALNIDSSFLLSLFSPDGDINNIGLDSQLTNDNILRDADVNVVGKELVQFIPPVLDSTFDDDSFHSYFDFVLGGQEDQKPGEKLATIKRERLSDFDCYGDINVSPTPPKKSKTKISRKKSSSK